jgi:hypothetical protein
MRRLVTLVLAVAIALAALGAGLVPIAFGDRQVEETG